jgi:hypothetical protein
MAHDVGDSRGIGQQHRDERQRSNKPHILATALEHCAQSRAQWQSWREF